MLHKFYARAARLAVLLWVSLVLAGLGCSERVEPGQSGPAHRSGLYPALTAASATNLAQARPLDARAMAWTNASFAVVETELSPAILVHSSSSYLALFQDLDRFGLGSPAYAAFSARSGPKGFKKGQMQPVIGMEENWLVVWFSGEKGWTNWDSPWAVFLQHKPTAMILNEEGLQLQFHEPAGDVVLMPFYGYQKLPLSGKPLMTIPGVKPHPIKTWEWGEVLSKEFLMRVRYWASASRRFPLACQDSFSVDAARDTVTIRQTFQWHAIVDDWNTRPLKLAPLSPPLALATLDRGFPVTMSKPAQDLDLFTPCGPYMAVEGVDSYEATFHVLKYVHETRTESLSQTNTPSVVAAALEQLRTVAQAQFRQPRVPRDIQGGMSNLWSVVAGCEWYAQGLPYYDASTRSNALAALKRFFSEEILVPDRLHRPLDPANPAHMAETAQGGGAGTYLLPALWAYAHFSGDWDLVKERWLLVQQTFVPLAQTRWAGFGRDGVDALGDQAAPCLAMARMAYRIGDVDTYLAACSMFARELVHLYVKQRGALYFRAHQPWHSMEPMDEEVYLTRLQPGVAGWHIDGPKYPAGAPERLFERRWVRFKSEDVGRFYLEHLKGDVQRELNLLGTRWPAERRYHNEPYLMPSLVQLRWGLLQEAPELLAQLAEPSQFAGSPAGVVADCLAMLHSGQPIPWQRLIPSSAPSPFLSGSIREVAEPIPSLTASVQSAGRQPPGTEASLDWPRIGGWESWRTPSGEGWNFGKIKPVRDSAPKRMSVIDLIGNTKAIVYEY